MVIVDFCITNTVFSSCHGSLIRTSISRFVNVASLPLALFVCCCKLHQDLIHGLIDFLVVLGADETKSWTRIYATLYFAYPGCRQLSASGLRGFESTNLSPSSCQ
jgi:hypothetical protein